VKAVTVHDCARELGESPKAVRRWISAGCPVASRGGRGRGRSTLLDVDAVRQWRSAGPHVALLLSLAGAIPELIADAIVESLRLTDIDGFDKRKLAGPFAGAWYRCTTGVLDRLRAHCATVPDVGQTFPEKIEALRKIAR
jgi:hypothetical protein